MLVFKTSALDHSANRPCSVLLLYRGGGCRLRSDDHLRAKQVLSQAELIPHECSGDEFRLGPIDANGFRSPALHLAIDAQRDLLYWLREPGSNRRGLSTLGYEPNTLPTTLYPAIVVMTI